ncbi:MAG: DUF3467 domain-containing protein [Acidobacteriota bacterium]
MDDPKNAPGQSQNLNVKISDDELKGRYANLVRISHTREEFILDFINFVPPQGMVTARMVMSPGHIKRLITALDRNLKLYEENHGDVREAPEPDGGMSSIN